MKGLFKMVIALQGLTVDGGEAWRGGCARDY